MYARCKSQRSLQATKKIHSARLRGPCIRSCVRGDRAGEASVDVVDDGLRVGKVGGLHSSLAPSFLRYSVDTYRCDGDDGVLEGLGVRAQGVDVLLHDVHDATDGEGSKRSLLRNDAVKRMDAGTLLAMAAAATNRYTHDGLEGLELAKDDGAVLLREGTGGEGVGRRLLERVVDVHGVRVDLEGSEEATSSGREGRHVVVERRDTGREDVDVRNDRGRRARTDDRGERGSSSSEDGDDGTGETHGGLSSKVGEDCLGTACAR